jgi:O-antigen/teichoic acid export membrane protein
MSEPRSDPADAPERQLTSDELRSRTSAGVFLVSAQGVAVLLLGVIGNVVLARLLTPYDFGIIAIGMSVMLIGGLLSDGGLGAGLIRRERPPDLAELSSLTAMQLGVASLVVALTAAIAIPAAGETGLVVTAMAASMPILVLQFPSRIMLERTLTYRPLVVVEITQVVVFNTVAISLVAAGLGVWGVAIATAARSFTAAVLMIRVSPVGFVPPRFSWARIRRLIAFGLQFQAINATWIVRDQLLNASIAAVAGLSTLGLWRLGTRIMDVPYLLLQSLWRVSFPAMSRWVTSGHEAAPVIRRTSGITAVGACTILTGLAASAPGVVPGVFGDQWQEVASVLPPACLAVALGGSVSVATQGYLYAVGDAGIVLRSGIVQAVVWLSVTVPLVSRIGVVAAGLGWLASAVAEAVILGRAVHARTAANVLAVLIVPLSVATAAGACGWLVSEAGGATLVSGIAGGLLAVALFHGGLMLVCRPLFLDSIGFVVRSMRSALTRADVPR